MKYVSSCLYGIQNVHVTSSFFNQYLDPFKLDNVRGFAGFTFYIRIENIIQTKVEGKNEKMDIGGNL